MHETSLVRNVVLLGHGKCGKTSLAEALLFTAGKTSRLGKVDDGSSIMDFEPEEVSRHFTISSSFNNYTWKKHLVFLADPPGDDNFVNEALFASRVADCALFVVGAVLGVKFQTEKFAAMVADRQLPALLFVNKMDRERADFESAVQSIEEGLPLNPAVIQLPIGAEADFKGVVDLVRNKAFLFEANGKVRETEVPADMAAAVAGRREALMEKVAETDDDLIEKFLEEGTLSDEDLLQGLKAAAKTGKLHPVAVGAALPNAGTGLLLDLINDLMPSPAERGPQTGTDPRTGDVVEREPAPEAPLSALVFKTIADPYAGRLNIFRVYSGALEAGSFYNASKGAAEKFGQLLLLEGKEHKPVDQAGPGMIVAVAKLKDTGTGDTLCAENAPVRYEPPAPIEPVISYAVTSGQKGDEEKLFASISKLLDEDPTLRLTRQPDTREILVSGVGQMHLEVIGERIKRKYGVDMSLQVPKVAYKETIKGKARAQGRHKKQTGGHGQFGDSWLEIEPLPRGGGFQFEDRIVGGVIPRQYIPAVEKGVVEAMSEGVVAGYPMVDLKVAVVDGSYHPVDSSEMAFKISGALAFRKAVEEAKPVLLEPIMTMTVRVPQDAVGDVIGDLNSRRGRVLGMDSEAKNEVITAQVPMAEIQQYAPDLTSITGGRGTFSVEISHYEEMPAQAAEKVIAAAKAQ
ncbi:MAG: elongation factor G [Desulfobacteraceae bacterium]|nr:elongation factor G [Desulfobacteraceae bacterium]